MTFHQLYVEFLKLAIDNCPPTTRADVVKSIAEDCAFMIQRGKSIDQLIADKITDKKEQ